ncbi:MAG TPA: hypothetical protein VHF69_00855 [Candidatus Synoicihabitans sp.]|nr:hypothetical protein [Candidatus Synoicihabitans sp.]
MMSSEENTKLDRLLDLCQRLDTAIQGDQARGVDGMVQRMARQEETFALARRDIDQLKSEKWLARLGSGVVGGAVVGVGAWLKIKFGINT